MEFLDFAEVKPTTSMDRIQDLYTQLITNILEVDNITMNIEKMEADEVEILEDLYRNEFMLYMQHIGIYEDLLNCIDNEPRTSDNEFELARIKKEASKLLRVQVVEL